MNSIAKALEDEELDKLEERAPCALSELLRYIEGVHNLPLIDGCVEAGGD